VALEPVQRSWLHARISARLDGMLAAGLVDEVRALRQRADLHIGLPAMRCVGYRQVWQWLDLHDAPVAPPGRPAMQHTPLGDAALREAIGAATRQLAKRQLTWLRSIPDRISIACDAEDASRQALQALHRACASGRRPGHGC
jgi:tRNA dimethylallyltransferase